jgi:hypothetical protein
MQTIRIFSLFIVLIGWTCSVAIAQDNAAVEQKLTSKYALTKTTADKTDIVTAGAILVLKKDNLMMMDISSSNLFQNTYKDGKISQNALGKLSRFHLPGVPAVPSTGGTQRTFVAGEKMWVTNISVKDSGVNVELYTDAINDVRYRAVLSFPFKPAVPVGEQADKLLAEVFDVQPSDDSSSGAQQPTPAAAAPQQAEAPPPAIPPPPPPADEAAPAPKTVALGQTKDMVTANFGQPDKIAKVGTKEIYYYKDFKVTFVNGKVTDVQ